MRQIAILGVGTMGSGMAENWLKKGFSLAVYNRT
jgi:3-hydroxyisobutyrate dehydrogenase-like beta-hydroxyacid dehydrogenase